MPHEKTGPQRKLSRPWYGHFRIILIIDPDLMLTKVYFLQDRTIQVHQSCVKVCPLHFPGGFYWYGGWHHGPGRPPRWVSKVLDSHLSEQGVSASAHSSGVTGGPADGASEKSTQESYPAATDQSTHDSTSSSAPRPACNNSSTSSSARGLHATPTRHRAVPRGLHASTLFAADVRDELSRGGGYVTWV